LDRNWSCGQASEELGTCVSESDTKRAKVAGKIRSDVLGPMRTFIVPVRNASQEPRCEHYRNEERDGGAGQLWHPAHSGNLPKWSLYGVDGCGCDEGTGDGELVNQSKTGSRSTTMTVLMTMSCWLSLAWTGARRTFGAEKRICRKWHWQCRHILNTEKEPVCWPSEEYEEVQECGARRVRVGGEDGEPEILARWSVR
uniref:Retrotransposon hot spot (RHS) protein n=1 Tax=Gongylonema pulchrum TaxID=637853 RepID=A0A183ENL5_9BILA